MNNTTTGFKFPTATMTSDATAAAWRIAGNQLIKLTKEPLVAALSRNLGPGDDALRVRIAQFLDTELGTAIVAALVSAGLSALPSIALPGVSTNAVPKLAQELRVKAMADAADFAADLLIGPLRESLALMILGANTQPETPASLTSSDGFVHFGDGVMHSTTA
jgi:hypothetical protein